MQDMQDKFLEKFNSIGDTKVLKEIGVIMDRLNARNIRPSETASRAMNKTEKISKKMQIFIALSINDEEQFDALHQSALDALAELHQVMLAEEAANPLG